MLCYWLGSCLRDTGWGGNFPELVEIGPVSHLILKSFSMDQYMLDKFLEAVGRGEVKGNNLKVVTTKEMYMSRIEDLLTPPKVEDKFPLVNFQELLYPRIKHPVLEVKQRDLMFSTETEKDYSNRREKTILFAQTNHIEGKIFSKTLSTSFVPAIK